MKSNFFEQLRQKFHERQVVRWIIFTYPKTCLSLGALLTTGYVAYMLDQSQKDFKQKIINQRKFYSEN